jgi:hypothetical protein
MNEGILFLLVNLLAWSAVESLTYLEERCRTQKLKAIAQQLGFQFFPQATERIQPLLSTFHLSSRGHLRQVRNLMKGKRNEKSVLIFDYQYTLESNKTHQPYWQTMVLLTDPALHLPQFGLRPRYINRRRWHGGWSQAQEIKFPEYQQFSQDFVVQGTTVPQIRHLFHIGVTAFYNTHWGTCTEGQGSSLLYYRDANWFAPGSLKSFRIYRQAPGAQPEPQEIPNLLAEALEVAELFKH